MASHTHTLHRCDTPRAHTHHAHIPHAYTCIVYIHTRPTGATDHTHIHHTRIHTVCIYTHTPQVRHATHVYTPHAHTPHVYAYTVHIHSRPTGATHHAHICVVCRHTCQMCYITCHTVHVWRTYTHPIPPSLYITCTCMPQMRTPGIYMPRDLCTHSARTWAGRWEPGALLSWPWNSVINLGAGPSGEASAGQVRRCCPHLCHLSRAL